MKRLVIALITAAFIFAPMSASALEMMSDKNMKDVTGQAGVSIGIDDIVIYQESVADVTYRDTDGLTVVNPYYESFDVGGQANSTKTSGLDMVGVKIDYADNMKKLITIDAIESESAGDYSTSSLNDLFGTTDVGILSSMQILNNLQSITTSGYDPLNGNVADSFTSGLSPLSIDVGSCPVLSRGLEYNTAAGVQYADPGDTSTMLTNTGVTADVAGVIIGLPTVEISTYHNNDTREIKVVSADTSDAEAINEGKAFIQIEDSGYSKMAILGGTVEIAPH
ncbi:MAG: hypothetical protein K9K82_13310 [Desulfobacteraceae bacterium]|nr:hypothetical protein [Desulfobacteraceae bacterium]